MGCWSKHWAVNARCPRRSRGHLSLTAKWYFSRPLMNLNHMLCKVQICQSQSWHECSFSVLAGTFAAWFKTLTYFALQKFQYDVVQVVWQQVVFTYMVKTCACNLSISLKNVLLAYFIHFLSFLPYNSYGSELYMLLLC